MWEVITYISSGFTLAAFIAALVAYALKAKIDERGRLIQSAKPEQRADLIRDALEFLHINADKLTREQQYNVAMEQIRARSERFKITSFVICFLALVAATVAIYSIYEERKPKEEVEVATVRPSATKVEHVAPKIVPAVAKVLITDQKGRLTEKRGSFNTIVFRVENTTDEMIRDATIEIIPGEWPTYPFPRRDDNSFFVNSARCKSISSLDDPIWKMHCDYIGVGGIVGFAVFVDEKDGYPSGKVVVINSEGMKKQSF